MRADRTIPEAIGPDHWFGQGWAMALSEVVETLDLGGGAGSLEVRVGNAEPGNWAGWAEPLWHTASWTPGQGARVWIGCADSVPWALWKHLGRSREPGAAEESLGTFREILNQTASGASAEAASRLRAPARASGFETAREPESGWALELRFRAGGEDCTLALAGNVALSKALQAPAPAGLLMSREPRLAESEKAAPKSDPLELIREVRLELTVSFGDTTMPLADVLNLAAGAIIELNRSVSDPVELVVNDSVIARGDVVVVDGNYGVRITEIVSRRERVRSML